MEAELNRGMNISRWIERWACCTPDKVAIWFENEEISYAELAMDIADLARVLASELHVEPGDRIAYLGYNHPRFLALLFACARIGAVVVPLNYRLAPPEHLFMLRDSGATVLLVDQECAASLMPVREQLGDCRVVGIEEGATWSDCPSLRQLLKNARRDALCPEGTLESPVLLIYTSGTTGTPKGALLKQSAILWNALSSQLMHDLQRSDQVLATLPFFHVGGLNIQTTPALHVGATLNLMRSFDSTTFIQLVKERRPNLTVLVPTQILAISEQPEWDSLDLSSLRCVTTGSTMVSRSTIELWHDRGVPILQCYGCTESCPIAIHNLPENAASTIGSVGRPAMYCDARVIDDEGNDVPSGVPGEILLRGPNLFKGYWGNPNATDRCFRDGWFRTGDMAYRSEEGDYYIVDRKSRMIISGGENIYPAELEGVLLDHPDVDEAVVVAYPDQRWGEVAVAAVVNHSGKVLNAKALKGLFVGRIGRLKHPRHIIALPSLPRNAMGKVIYADIQSRLAALLAKGVD